MKEHVKYILKNSTIFATISFLFSIIGGLFPGSEHTYIVGNPLVVSPISIEHVGGHIFWGAIVGLATLKIRYVVLGGSFAILLDADHLLQFLDIEMVGRMSHSIPFALITVVVFLIIFKGKDLRLAAVAFSAVLAHIAFDVFLADVAFNTSSAFPLLSPFLLETINLEGMIWIGIQVIGVIIVAIVSFISTKKKLNERVV